MTVDGGFAEYAVHHVSALYPLPSQLTFEDAVLITTAGTGLYGLDVPGGYATGQVICVGTRPSRLDLASRFGAEAFRVVRERDGDPVKVVIVP